MPWDFYIPILQDNHNTPIFFPLLSINRQLYFIFFFCSYFYLHTLTDLPMYRFIFLYILFLFVRCTNHSQVDLIVYNAKVYTVDSTFSVAEAFAVNDGMFIDIGSSEQILKRYRAKETIDAKQRAV